MLQTRTHRLISLLVLGILVMGGTVWFFYPKSIKADPDKVEFLYCKPCAKEFIFERTKHDLKDPCPLCGGKRIPLSESIKKTQLKNPYAKMLTYVFIELVAFLAALWFVLQPREVSTDDEYFYTNCPSCRQKIRYTEKQVGKPAVCRRCKKTFEFPELEAVR